MRQRNAINGRLVVVFLNQDAHLLDFGFGAAREPSTIGYCQPCATHHQISGYVQHVNGYHFEVHDAAYKACDVRRYDECKSEIRSVTLLCLSLKRVYI